MTYSRVLLKLSGEVFGGGAGIGVDPDVVQGIAAQIADVARSGVVLRCRQMLAIFLLLSESSPIPSSSPED